jgi:hypothetical protein
MVLLPAHCSQKLFVSVSIQKVQDFNIFYISILVLQPQIKYAATLTYLAVVSLMSIFWLIWLPGIYGILLNSMLL